MPANQKYKAGLIFPVQQTSKNLPALKGSIMALVHVANSSVKRVLSSVVDHEWG